MKIIYYKEMIIRPSEIPRCDECLSTKKRRTRAVVHIAGDTPLTPSLNLCEQHAKKKQIEL